VARELVREDLSIYTFIDLLPVSGFKNRGSMGKHTNAILSANICCFYPYATIDLPEANFRFEPPFGGLRGNVHGSPMARRKVHCRLPISNN